MSDAILPPYMEYSINVNFETNKSLKILRTSGQSGVNMPYYQTLFCLGPLPKVALSYLLLKMTVFYTFGIWLYFCTCCVFELVALLDMLRYWICYAT
jgi:hypothetical protein